MIMELSLLALAKYPLESTARALIVSVCPASVAFKDKLMLHGVWEVVVVKIAIKNKIKRSKHLENIVLFLLVNLKIKTKFDSNENAFKSSTNNNVECTNKIEKFFFLLKIMSFFLHTLLLIILK